jgi:hypothetical protein
MRRRTRMETGKVIGRLSSKGQFTLPAEAPPPRLMAGVMWAPPGNRGVSILTSVTF